jgi:hypothetical protein
MVHQILTLILQVNLYVLYILGLPAILTALASGGVTRVLRYRTAMLWVGFALWVLLDVPFSTWRGGSAGLIFSYLRTDFIMLFIIGGLATDWRECRLVLWTVAAASVFNLFISRYFGQVDANDRVSLVYFGTVSNANDFAGHLVLVLPFLLWVAMCAKSFLVRILAVIGLVWGLYLVLASASRGAAVAVAVGLVFLVLFAPGRLKPLFLVLSVPLVLGIGLVLPERVLNRIFSFSATGTNVSEEAIMSSELRKKLFYDSLKYTVDYPLFGVGPGQFPIQEGLENKKENPNAAALWCQTHNSFTQISSECGIPAVILYTLGIGSTMLLFRRTARKIQGVPRLADMQKALFCLQLSMVAFCTAILFLNFGYFFYLPGMAGFAIILDLAATTELSAALPAPPPAFNAGLHFQPAPRLPGRRPIPVRFDGKMAGPRT